MIVDVAVAQRRAGIACSRHHGNVAIRALDSNVVAVHIHAGTARIQHTLRRIQPHFVAVQFAIGVTVANVEPVAIKDRRRSEIVNRIRRRSKVIDDRQWCQCHRLARLVKHLVRPDHRAADRHHVRIIRVVSVLRGRGITRVERVNGLLESDTGKNTLVIIGIHVAHNLACAGYDALNRDGVRVGTIQHHIAAGAHRGVQPGLTRIQQVVLVAISDVETTIGNGDRGEVVRCIARCAGIVDDAYRSQ